MDRRKFTFGTLIGIFGIKALAQVPNKVNPPLSVIEGPTHSCLAMDYEKTDCELKEGEERCPIGHAQKPEYSWLDGHTVDHPAEEVTHHPEIKMDTMCGGGCMIPKDPTVPAYDTYRTNLHICTTCGIAYIPRKK